MWTRFNNKTKSRDTHIFTTRFIRCWSFALFAPSLSFKEIKFIGRAKFYLSPLSSSIPLNIIPVFVLVFLLQIKVFENNGCHWGCLFILCKNGIAQFFSCFLAFLLILEAPHVDMADVVCYGNYYIVPVFHYNRLHLSRSAVSSQNC